MSSQHIQSSLNTPLPVNTPSPSRFHRPDATQALSAALVSRILVLDGAMGTMIQRSMFSEAEFRGERFADWHRDLRGNNELLTLT